MCKMLTNDYGESATIKIRVYEWYKCFQDSRKDVEDDERAGRRSISTTHENVKKSERNDHERSPNHNQRSR